jgi:hypothetical protein
MGERSAGNPHAAFDVAGAGNVARSEGFDPAGAPVLDPTTDEAIAAWRAELRTTRGGQPRYSPLAITTALTLRMLFRLGLRQTEGLVGSIFDLLGLDLAVPDHTTLSRRAVTLEVVRSPSSTVPVHLLIDSTGLKLCGAGEWLIEKHGTTRRRSWRKLHIGVDAETGQIVAAVLSTHDVDDASQVGALLGQIDGPVASFTADGAYDQENPRNRKTPKRGRKRLFNAAIHSLRLRVERTFAWEDKFKRLLLRFEFKQQRHYGMKLMAYTLINLRYFCGA